MTLFSVLVLLFAQPAILPAQRPAQAKGNPAVLSKVDALNATIDALAANGSDVSWEALKKIITGEVDAGELDQQAAKAALAKWAMRGSPESEQFLAEALSHPESIRPAGQGLYTPEELQADVASHLAMVASPGLRSALADQFLVPDTSPIARRAIVKILRAPHPENVPLQLRLLTGNVADADVKSELLASLGEINREMLREALGLEAEGSGMDAAGTSAGVANLPPGIDPSQLPPGLDLSKLPPGIDLSKLPPGIDLSKLPPGLDLSKLPPGLDLSKLPPGLDLSKLPADLDLSKLPPGVDLSQLPASSTTPPTGDSSEVAPKSNSEAPPADIAGALFGALKSALGNGGQGAHGSGPPTEGAATVSGVLWSDEFANTLGEQLQSEEADHSQLLSILASLPSQSGRKVLKDYLSENWSKGPTELAGASAASADSQSFTEAMDAANTVDAQQAAISLGFNNSRRGKKKKDDDDDDGGRAAIGLIEESDEYESPANRIGSFGEDWLDPGALVVLKSIPYADRPKSSSSRRSSRSYARSSRGSSSSRPKSPAQLRREEEKAERLKAQESKYEWRDAVELYVRLLGRRFESLATETDLAAADESAAGSLEVGDVPDEADAGEFTAPPFELYPSDVPVTEFHGRWPAANGPGAAIPSTLAVRYIRIEAEGSYTKAVSHYRRAVDAKPNLREIEEGRWIDYVQESDESPKSRSIDILVTRDDVDSDEKGDEQLLIEILIVEIDKL